MSKRFVWVRVPLDIYTRDRAGGHMSQATDDCGWTDYCGPVAAKAMKKASRRKQRRQHAKVIRDWEAFMMADVKDDLDDAKAAEDARWAELADEWEDDASEWEDDGSEWEPGPWNCREDWMDWEGYNEDL